MFQCLRRALSPTLALAALVAAASSQAAEPINIIWYGNSFTNATCCGGTASVPAIFNAVAVAAGQPAPNNVNRSSNGQSLQWHLTNNTAGINGGISASDDWDYVVLQDFSTMPTHIGNLSQHLSSTLGMYNAVAARSPDVTPVLYETWARGPGHSFYTGGAPSFPGGPAQMQQELRDGYLAAQANINASAGAGTALVAPVGDAFEEMGFPLSLYAGDIYHAQNRGSLLATLVLYGTIYGDTTTSDIPLGSILTSLNISTTDAAAIAAAADAVLAPVIPEPTSAAMALAVVGLSLARRRRG
ncbi:hypothetical protein [Botrimarina mediterranea]|uniref:PEP-CTERM protein-sorting domain-containing protein n=1 Tax=Botrimarina mediterranea TaxID=2528022 RepID=A0A518K2H0_9BACT|nr:hypothetical protein [Botrimarina mediterranea]QDV72003.1 hypothetical protein Spa11_01730 [Botrimarina mediterranea]QDV76544.1 hypothetical protein K2D_01230 [Planctomycetes bacterium K2D]